MPSELDDDRRWVGNFTADILVGCPKCREMAHLRQLADAGEQIRGYRFTCDRCGAQQQWLREPKEPFYSPVSGPRLEAFDLELWLQEPCCGHTLWAHNGDHLEYLESFVQARLRARRPHPTYGWANSSMASRLPRWLKAAKNRDAVLRAIGRLRARLAGVG